MVHALPGAVIFEENNPALYALNASLFLFKRTFWAFHATVMKLISLSSNVKSRLMFQTGQDHWRIATA